MLEISIFNTFLGNMKLVSQENHILECVFTEEPAKQSNDVLHLEATKQLEAYFSGELQNFDLPLAPKGTTFQKSVWSVLQSIPYGKTVSYADLAKRIGSNANPRNVGGANGANPIAIIIPCHRIIGKSGQLTGYAGGIERKRKLLELEGAISKELF